MITVLLVALPVVAFAIWIVLLARNIVHHFRAVDDSLALELGPSKCKSSDEFDVVIMGGGVGGMMQALHLKRHLGQEAVNVAVVEPLDPKREGDSRKLKIGEATVEISAMFFVHELGLMDAFIERQVPKHSLIFNWPKAGTKDTNTMDQYDTVSLHGEPQITSWQFNRATLEADLSRRCAEAGVVMIQGRVQDFSLEDSPADTRANADGDDDSWSSLPPTKEVTVSTASGTTRKLRGRHLVDAAGRRFLIGQKADNLIKGPQWLFGLQNGSAWLRVKGFDRRLFNALGDTKSIGSSQYTAHSPYYATNHFFGRGHWIWMIPLEVDRPQEEGHPEYASGELSIGVVFHRPYWEPSEFNTLEKTVAWFRTHHQVLGNLIDSGEVEDFEMWPSIPHMSKRLASPDRWSVIGDAAVFFDPFYSTGLVLTSLAVQMTTEMVRRDMLFTSGVSAHLDTEADIRADVEAMAGELVGEYWGYGSIYQKHAHHLGNAAVMSWRILFENILWFQGSIPTALGKFHLYPNRKALGGWDPATVDGGYCLKALIDYVYEVFDDSLRKWQETGKNPLPMVNPYGSNQLRFAKGFLASSHWDVDNLIPGGKWHPLSINISASHRQGIWMSFLLAADITVHVHGAAALITHAPFRALAFQVAKALAITTTMSLPVSLALWWTGRGVNRPMERMIKERAAAEASGALPVTLPPPMMKKETSA